MKPDKPKPFPQLNLPDPDPGSNDDLPDKDGPYNEDDRKPIWWYHSDHLGSSTYLTDNFGRPSHYYETLPFGEMIVEHNQSTYYKSPYPTTNTGDYDNAYKFNGKELDAATGMYYYGARYYDPRISIFVSVDPLAEEFVGWTPYHYVHQNPINLIDPTGMSAEGTENDCDSCKTEEDWKAYYQQARNTASMIGDNIDDVHWGLSDRMSYDSDEDGHRIYYLDGEKMDLRQYDNRLHAASSLISDGVLIETPAIVLKNIRKVFNSLFGKTSAQQVIQLTKKTFGHTFTTHGDDMTQFLINRAKGSGMAQGQFLDNQKAAQFILDNIDKTANGAVNIPIPKNLPARVIMPDGTFKTATHVRLVPGGGGVKTAYPLIP